MRERRVVGSSSCALDIPAACRLLAEYALSCHQLSTIFAALPFADERVSRRMDASARCPLRVCIQAWAATVASGSLLDYPMYAEDALSSIPFEAERVALRQLLDTGHASRGKGKGPAV